MPIRAIVNNIEVFANVFSGGDNIKCPNCDQEMIFVNPVADIIKHFRHKVECPYSTEPESIEHIEMKGFLKRNIPGARVEVKIGRRIADILIEDIVIECQASSITLRELKERTYDYNNNGYWVLWILHWKNYAVEGKQTKIVERFLQTKNYGRFYLFNADEIVPIHYRRISPCEFCKNTNQIYSICSDMKCWYFNEETERPYSMSTRYRGYRNSDVGKKITSFLIKKNYKNGFAMLKNDGGNFWGNKDD